MGPTNYERWYMGDPAMIERGRAALAAAGAFRDGDTNLRTAVARWQKRRGYVPTGWLGPEGLAELLSGTDAEAVQDEDSAARRNVENRGGYSSSSKQVSDLTPPPRGPAPGALGPQEGEADVSNRD